MSQSLAVKSSSLINVRPSSSRSLSPQPKGYAQFEVMYYLSFPNSLTLEDFAREVEELKLSIARPDDGPP